MQKESNDVLFRVNGDIISTLKTSEDIGWESITEYSIQRIMYIASVLYSFRYENKFNPFVKDYDFSVSLRGPFSSIIPSAVYFLIANEFINYNENKELVLSGRQIPNLNLMPYFEERKNWIESIVYILGIYGEEKIYDFVFRDPQYQDNVQRNSIKEIDIKPGNKTDITVRRMKGAFEKGLGNSASQLSHKEYLDMYFDYVFSKILRGETE
ncbi:hypothetical protein G8C92_28030 [Paenibacillus donghaensis]|uniref:hypothetical protein n=1 Tax=Paenibacillus donghaensis TaxID=414771 RepID=UPI001884250D|nr:hypothetical protein [Paenibacillus donghaensis]MBE9917854.1 hypothetical protein [Paenibacillus donghaensis]